uniref:Uncharacterized protein n=1 Tax=Vespula pensylvanica TaxID=30213 RepID=A0A834NSF3_VESPE|nr:hypothetical protein H0235_011644 [Vespula pensylvanica]
MRRDEEGGKEKREGTRWREKRWLLVLSCFWLKGGLEEIEKEEEEEEEEEEERERGGRRRMKEKPAETVEAFQAA